LPPTAVAASELSTTSEQSLLRRDLDGDGSAAETRVYER